MVNYYSLKQTLLGNLGKLPCEGQLNFNLLFWLGRDRQTFLKYN